MVSACAYSGAYPTGYGPVRAEHRRRAAPDVRASRSPPASPTSSSPAPARSASTTTTSASPRCSSRWTASARPGTLTDEVAEPGYYAATLASGIRCEITVGPQSAVHRYTFPAHRDARIVIDFSLGGLAIPYGATVPLRAHLETLEPGVAQAEIGRRGGTAGGAPGVRRRRLAPAALVRPAADARRHPARLRPDPADHAAAVRPDVARPDRARPGGRAALRLLPARRRAGPGEPATDAPADRRPAVTGALRRPDAPAHDAAAWHAGWRSTSTPIKVDTPSGGAADGLLHRALPLADQAVLRVGREPVLARPTARSSSTSARCGTSTAPSCR